MIDAAIAVSPEAAAYQAAADASRLLYGHCNACNAVHHYPRRICPFCWSNDVEWRAASGSGTIYSFSVVRRADSPYAPAYVELPEGVTILTNIVEADLDAIRIGDPVELAFTLDAEGHQSACFRPMT